MILTQMIYASKIREGLKDRDIEHILEKSRVHNTRDEITGILCFHRKFFVQALEGERSHVNQTFKRISLDKRHSDVIIISYRQIDIRSFSKWSMAYVPECHITKDLLLKYSVKSTFNPYILSDTSAIGLLTEMSDRLLTKSRSAAA